MTKEEIAGVLEQIATLLELKGENPFKIRAYANAPRAIETFGGNISNLQDEEALAKILGVEAQFLAMSCKLDICVPRRESDRVRASCVSYLIFQTMVSACRRGAAIDRVGKEDDRSLTRFCSNRESRTQKSGQEWPRSS